MTRDTVAAFLGQYVLLRSGSFSQTQFLDWAAHRGLARTTLPEYVEQAFDSALIAREIEHAGYHGAVPLFRRAA